MAMNTTIYKFGFWSGIIAFTATVAYCIVQLLQLYDVITYPTDERLIYGTSLCIVIPFVIEILALHYTTPESKKFWTHAALIFTILYAAFVTANYVVQLATVIPNTLKGLLNEVRILQQTPHSLFWNFDAVGYIFMGLATLVAIPAFEKEGFQKWVRISFVANAAVTPLISMVYFYPTYSYNLLLLGFPWAVTAPLSMLLLALNFRKELKDKKAGK
jgi:heme/copper-type cytochrome/quinol oxidase subunit 4